MAIELIETASGNKLNIDANGKAQVALAADYTQSGFAALAAEPDPGTATGTRLIRQCDVTGDYRLRTGVDTILFYEGFPLTAINSAQWNINLTTMISAVAAPGWLKLNSGAITTASAVARVQTYRTFGVFTSFPLYLECPFQYVAAANVIANTVTEVGFGIATGIAAPTDGVFLRWNAAGEIRGVVSSNSAETTSPAVNLARPAMAALFTPNVTHQFLAVINQDRVEFWVDGVLATTVSRGAGTPSLASTMQLPVLLRTYNTASTPGSAVQLWVGPLTISHGDVASGRAWSDTLSLQGGGAYQGQSGGTMGQTANWTNSTEPVAATLSNTAAGYTTLGGQWTFAAPAGAVTDFCLFGFQVPALAADAANKNLIIRGIRIAATNAGAAVATTATILQWGIAVGSTAVSLATAEATTTKAPRRIALGVQSFLVGAGIGQDANAIDVKFAAPLLAEPGTFVQVICRVPVGTATASQTPRGTVSIDAQYE